jgi:long-chain acyl-CoA synthetase
MQPRRHWFEDRQLLSAWLWDVLMHTMKRVRPSFEAPEFHPDILLNRQQCGIDSIELVDLATQLFISLDTETSGAFEAHSRQSGKLGNAFSDWLNFAELAAKRTSTLGFQTSGSTGNTSWHAHAYQHLMAEAIELAALCAQRNIQRVVCLVPYHHLYGFIFGLLLPKVLQVPVISVRGIESAPLLLGSSLRESDLLIANPRWLQSAQQSGMRIKSACSIVSSSQVLPDACFEWASHQGIFLMDVYGCTELAGVGTRTQPGVFLALPRYTAGTKPECVMDTYTATEKAALDHLSWLDDRQFAVMGRIDQAFQVAGHNVYPFELAARIARSCAELCALPLHQFEVRIRAWPNDASARAHALIAVANDAAQATLRSNLSNHLQKTLRDFEFPASLQMRSEVPVNQAGKEANWLIP